MFTCLRTAACAAATVALVPAPALGTTVIEDLFTAGTSGDALHGLAPDTANVPGSTWSFTGNADVWGLDAVAVQDHGDQGRIAAVPQFDTGGQLATAGTLGGEVTLSARLSVPTGPNFDAHRAMFLGTWQDNQQQATGGSGMNHFHDGGFRGIGINRAGEIVTRDNEWRQTGLFVDDFDDTAFHDLSLTFDAASGSVTDLSVGMQSFDFAAQSAVASPFADASLNHVGFGSPGGGGALSSFSVHATSTTPPDPDPDPGPDPDPPPPGQDGGWGPDFSIVDGSLKIPGVGPDNPVIYDNDWWLDVIDSGFAAAQHHLGRMDLRGFITTADMWDGGRLYSLQDSIDDFTEFRNLAIESGWTRTPDYTAGAADPLQQPASGNISDTVFTPTDGSNLIVEEAMKASPEEPLVLVVGGAPTTVATALLQKPEIAERMIVLWLAIREYNAQDQWGSHVMLQRAPVVHYNFQLRDGLTQEMLDSLPETPLNVRYRDSGLVLDNAVGDGVLLTWLFDNSLITGAEKQNLTNLISFSPTTQRPYDFLHIPNEHKRSTEIAQHMIDTLAIPEPTTAVLLGIGGALILMRRR